MAWLAVDKNGGELIFRFKPERKLDTDYMTISYWGWYDLGLDDWGGVGYTKRINQETNR